MQTVKINGVKRAEFGKKGAKDIRREKLIPCVLYGHKEETVHFSISASDARPLLYTHKSFIVEITIDGEAELAVMREVQFHPVKDYPMHIDFFRVMPGKPVTIDIPVILTGNAEGVKAGGKLSLSRRKLTVSGLSENLPDDIVIDVTSLGLGKAIFVSDLHYEGLTIINPAKTAVCSILTTRQAAAAAEEGEAEGEAAPAEGEAAEA